MTFLAAAQSAAAADAHVATFTASTDAIVHMCLVCAASAY